MTSAEKKWQVPRIHRVRRENFDIELQKSRTDRIDTFLDDVIAPIVETGLPVPNSGELVELATQAVNEGTEPGLKGLSVQEFLEMAADHLLFIELLRPTELSEEDLIFFELSQSISDALMEAALIAQEESAE